MTTAPFAPAEAPRTRLRDADLRAAIVRMFGHDDRLRGLDLGVSVAGGVVHLTGDVADRSELDVARRLIGRLAGVMGVWDQIRVGGREPVILDLGCGETKQYPRNIGVDLRATGAVDVRADLAGPLPFGSRTADRVFLVHVLEHFVDFLPLLDECHRVLRPDGLLHLMSPWWRHVNAVADPTHVRLFDVQTVKGICLSVHARRWFPVHVGCDGASVFADLAPLEPGAPPLEPTHLARFFD